MANTLTAKSQETDSGTSRRPGSESNAEQNQHENTTARTATSETEQSGNQTNSPGKTTAQNQNGKTGDKKEGTKNRKKCVALNAKPFSKSHSIIFLPKTGTWNVSHIFCLAVKLYLGKMAGWANRESVVFLNKRLCEIHLSYHPLYRFYFA